MSFNRSNHAEPGGPIAYMAGNSVASNLLMFGILAAGLVSLTGLEQEGWPTVPFNQFEISVVLPGATPEEVEEAIVVKIEDEVRGLADVRTWGQRRMKSSRRSGAFRRSRAEPSGPRSGK